MAEQTEVKRKRGHPPWTEEQKARASKQKREARAEKDRQDLEKYSELTGIALRKMDEKPPIVGKSHSKSLREARVALDLPPIDIRDPKQVEKRCNEYLDFCEARDKRPQIIGLCNWLGVHRDTIVKWRSGVFEKSPATPIIQRIFVMLEEYMVEDTMACDKNPASLIFLMKNMFQYRDQTEITVNAGAQNDREMSDDEIADWYLNEGKKPIETTFKDE
jgi:hypothetical protein